MSTFIETPQTTNVNIAAFDASSYPLTFITKKFYSLEPTVTDATQITDLIGSYPLVPAVWSAAIQKLGVDSDGNPYSFML